MSMVDAGNRHPGSRPVTVLTDITGLDMIHVLTGGSSAIVTADAITGNTAVIKRG